MEIEIEFVGIEHLEHDDLVAGGSEAGEVVFEFIGLREQIGDEHDHSAFADKFGGAAKGFAEVGLFSIELAFEREHQLTQMAVAMARGEIFAHAFVESEQSPPRRLATVQKPRERRGESVRAYSDLV